MDDQVQMAGNSQDDSEDEAYRNKEVEKSQEIESASFTCGICNRHYYSEIELEEHIFTHEETDNIPDHSVEVNEEKIKKQKLSCGICKANFKTEKIMKQHYRYSHTPFPDISEAKPVEKSDSGKTDKTTHVEAFLQTFIAIRSGKRFYKCGLCDKQFWYIHLAKKHLSTRHTKYECSICEAVIHDRYTLNCHMLVHKGQGPTCQICSKTFTFKYLLKRHMLIHTGDEPYSCETCGKSYINKQSLKRHIYNIHKVSLKQHVNTYKKNIEMNIQRTTCDVCGLLVASSYISCHMRIHTNDKPYKCHICGQAFIQASNRERHLLVHTNEKRFKCDQCDAAYKNKDCLRTHKQAEHSNSVGHKCRICSKKFKYPNSLATHGLTHTGEKPYSCEICGKSFSQSSSLKLHMVTHTRIKAFSCSICQARFTQRGSVTRHMKQFHEIDQN